MFHVKQIEIFNKLISFKKEYQITRMNNFSSNADTLFILICTARQTI